MLNAVAVPRLRRNPTHAISDCLVQTENPAPRAEASIAALTAEGQALSGPARLEYVGGDPPPPGAVRELLEGIDWLRMPLPIDLNHINLWLLRQDDGYTLIDTGLPVESCTAVWQQLEATLLRDRPLRRILLTHLHPDHLGCAGWLQQRHNVPVRMAARAMPVARSWLNGHDAAELRQVAQYFAAHGIADSDAVCQLLSRRLGSGIARMPDVRQPLVEGELITAGDWRFEVIETDGHAIAHQGFYSEEPAVLISGDQVLPAISPNISVSPGNWGSDPLGDYLASLDRLERLPAQTLVLPSHGRPFRGLRERIAVLRAHHEQKVALLLAALHEPRSAGSLLMMMFGRALIGWNQMLGLYECVAHLEHLVQRGAAQREMTGGQYLYRTV